MEHTQIKVWDVLHRPYQPTGLEGIWEVFISHECLQVQTQEQADRINNWEDVESVLKNLTPEDLASTKE